MKKPIFTVSCILALFLCACCSEPKNEPSDIVIMSYNIRNSKANDGENSWENRKGATSAMLDTINPDVFGIQEAYPNQIQHIIENCPRYKYYGVGRENGISSGEHMAIFYNTDVIELLKSGTYWLSDTPDVPSKGWDAYCKRTATWALMQVKADGRLFYYVNTHLDHKGVEARKNGLALIVDKIAEMNKEGYPMVLTGDFNVEPGDECLSDLNTKMKDARQTALMSDTKPSFQGFGLYPETIIDYIYYKGFSQCKEFRVVNETFVNIPYISDHFPIIAKLTF